MASEPPAGVRRDRRGAGPLALPPFARSLYLLTVFCSKKENGGRKALPSRGLRFPDLFFLQLGPLISVLPFLTQAALPQGGRRCFPRDNGLAVTFCIGVLGGSMPMSWCLGGSWSCLLPYDNFARGKKKMLHPSPWAAGG